eukprot:scaffold24644_cov63-Phaeocystis_antarctica.AAC.2
MFGRDAGGDSIERYGGLYGLRHTNTGYQLSGSHTSAFGVSGFRLDFRKMRWLVFMPPSQPLALRGHRLQPEGQPALDRLHGGGHQLPHRVLGCVLPLGIHALDLHCLAQRGHPGHDDAL